MHVGTKQGCKSYSKRVFTSYEEGLLTEVKASLIDECFPFIRLELSWYDIKNFMTFKA